jgi:hypothetical protein
MLARGEGSLARFSATFPQRFAAALADAQGTIAGIAGVAASSDGRRGLIDADTLRRLHEIYRLRVELEIETAGVLWRTAEVVCALTDAIEVLSRRRLDAPAPPLPWLGVISAAEIESKRQAPAIGQGTSGRTGHWPRFAGPASGNGEDPSQSGAWPPGRHAEEYRAEAA